MAGSVAYQVDRPRAGVSWDSDEAGAWLARARSSLALARSNGRGIQVEDLCRLAREAVERAIRAALIAEGIPLPADRSIRGMLSSLELAGVPVPDRLARAAALFPGEDSIERVRIEKYYEAIMVASETIRFAEERLRAA
jgi:HEPN domain-containing protein